MKYGLQRHLCDKNTFIAVIKDWVALNFYKCDKQDLEKNVQPQTVTCKRILFCSCKLAQSKGVILLPVSVGVSEKVNMRWGSSLGAWGIWSASSLPLFSGPLWPGVVVPVRVLSMGQIELFNLLIGIIIINYLKLYNCVQARRLLWYSGYCHRKWTGRTQFKSW